MKKVIRNNKVAVLISHGFGAGWYTSNEEQEVLLYHPKLVDMVEQNRANEINEEWVLENLKIKNVYCGGAEDLQIHWITVGTSFSVDEFDGAESLRTLEDLILIA
jgi:hypothetical protein